MNASLDVRVAADEAALAAEIAATNSDVGSIDTRVAAEEAMRASKDLSLQSRLALEEGTRLAEVGSIDTRVAAEEAARAAADTSLQTRLAAEEAAHAADSGSLQTRLAAEEGARAAGDVALGLRVDAVEASYRQYAQLITAGGTMSYDLTSGPDAAKSVLNNSIQIYLNGIRLHLDGAATSNGTCTNGDYWYDAATDEIHVQDVMVGDMVEVQFNLI
jgi:hypothetical protein